MRFYLGTHRPHWLGLTDTPLFVSRARMYGPGDAGLRLNLPVARGPWALDSGAFSQLDNPPYRWTLTPEQYAAQVRRLVRDTGRLEWAAPQDWMCEQRILDKTRLTIGEHLRRTVDNLVRLRTLAPDLPFVPVLQGWALDDYLRCADLYEQAGVDLAAEPLVGLGTVCRRQDTRPAEQIVRRLAGDGYRLHGFGVKLTGLERYWDALVSADSLAWSLDARMRERHGLASCDPARRKACANCLHYALEWLDRKVLPLADPDHQPLWREAPCAA